MNKPDKLVKNTIKLTQGTDSLSHPHSRECSQNYHHKSYNLLCTFGNIHHIFLCCSIVQSHRLKYSSCNIEVVNNKLAHLQYTTAYRHSAESKFRLNPTANCKSKETLKAFSILHAELNIWSAVISPCSTIQWKNCSFRQK